MFEREREREREISLMIDASLAKRTEVTRLKYVSSLLEVVNAECK